MNHINHSETIELYESGDGVAVVAPCIYCASVSDKCCEVQVYMLQCKYCVNVFALWPSIVAGKYFSDMML